MDTPLHTIELDSNSWHARWYRSWQRLGGRTRAPSEDRCHYLAVIVIWAPLRWFTRAKLNALIRPWTVALVTAIGTLTGLSVALWPHRLLWLLTFIGEVLLFIGALALLIGVCGVLVHVLLECSERAFKIAAAVTFPIWVLPFLAFRLVVPAGRFIGRARPSLRAVLIVSAILAGIGGLAYFWPKALLVFGLLVAVICVVVGLMLAIGLGFDPVAERVGRLVAYITEKKRGTRVCPTVTIK
jgi:hypothetical protein